MILRSVTKHVKEQNWFAVGLDFFIVVVGILMAFQIESWAEQRNEVKKFERHVELVKTEMQDNLNRLTGLVEVIDARINIIVELRDLLSHPEKPLTNKKMNELLVSAIGVPVVNVKHKALASLVSSELYNELINAELIALIEQWELTSGNLERVHKDDLNYRDTLLQGYFTNNISVAAILQEYIEPNPKYPYPATKFLNSREALAKDPVLENILTVRYGIMRVTLEYLETLTQQTNELITQIDQRSASR